MCNGHGGDLHPRKEQMMGVFGFGRANLLKVSLVLAAAVLAACLLAFVVRVEPSQAAFPGQNGKIAFVSTRDGSYEIYTMNADGSNPTRLTNNETLDLLPAFSPDGTKIVFVRENDPTFEDLNVYVMKADGSGQTDLNNPDLDSKDESPSFSPDGTKIVFASQVYAVESFSDIYVMKADGSGRTNLSNYPASADFDPVFSPDGTRIAFVSMRDDADPFSFFGGEIYVMKADGSGQTNITNNAAGDRSPDWSPDGNKIAFMSNRDGGDYEIYVMNADGSNPTNITNNAAPDSYPAWSPDGTKIAFTRNTQAGLEIYVMNADGSNQINITNNTAGDEWPAWQPNTAPSITNVRPASGSNTTDRTPTIAATVTDQQTNLAKSNITLFLDGATISRTAYAYNQSTDRMSYTPQKNLMLGQHTVKVDAQDGSGLSTTKSWSFKIVHP
jgi:Tol biopolymer transport system component